MGGATAVGPSAHVAHLIRCTQLGLPASQLAEVDDVLGSMPCVTLKASCSIEARRRYRAACVVRSAALTAPLSVQGEEQTDIHENDFATCTVTVHLERLHDTRPAGTPYMPAKSDEGWWLLLGDLASNTLFAVQKARLAALVPANTVGADAADPGSGSSPRRRWVEALPSSGEAGGVPRRGGQRRHPGVQAPVPGAPGRAVRAACHVHVRHVDWVRHQSAAEAEGASHGCPALPSASTHSLVAPAHPR